MQKELLDWITSKKFLPMAQANDKDVLFRLLQKEPEKVEAYVNKNMHNWCVIATLEVESGSVVCNDITDSGKLVVAHLQQYFSKEIAALAA